MDGQASEPRRGLLEREEAEAAIGAALGGVEGGGAALFLTGATGLGKTSLLRRAEHVAFESGFRVAAATGSPMETSLPFGLVGQAIVALGGDAVEDAVELERLGGRPTRFYRTLRWLSEVASAAPLLLALDDLHWADPDSLELLGFLVRRLAGSRVLVLGTLRPEPDPASLLARDLVAAGHARLVTLEPLSPAASRSLAERVLARPLAASEGEWLVDACAGTPLLLEMATRRLGLDGPGPAPAVDGRLVSELLLARFAGVGAEADRYLRAASVLGVRFRPALAGAVAEMDYAVAVAAHGRLVRARLLDDLGAGRAAFVHPLFAQALLEAQPLAERERLHARAFRLLVEDGAPDAVAAEHAVAGHLVGDPLAVEVAARAGRAALAQGAVQVASTHLEHAVALAGRASADELLLDLATALVARACFEDATRICARLLGRSELDPSVRVQTLRLQARAAFVDNRPHDAQRLYEEAAAVGDRSAEAETLLDAALTCQISSSIPWIAGTTGRALALLPAEAPPRPALEVLAAYASLLGGDASRVEWLVEAARGFALRDVGDDGPWMWPFAVHFLNVFKTLERLEEATDLFEREFERAAADGAPVLMNALAIAYADAAQRLGRPQEALELVEHAAALGDWPMPPWSDLARAALLTDLGRDDEARPHLEAMRAFQDGIPVEFNPPVSLWLCVLDARRLLGSGQPEKASETMLRAAEISRVTGWSEPCIVPWAGVALDAHLAAGRTAQAEELVEELARLAEPLPCRWPRAIVALGRARLAAAAGRDDEAEREFAAALGALAELPMPIALAEALVAYGVHLRGSGRPREARAPLARALQLAARSGSERVARVARAELAAAGGRPRRDRHPSRLTAQEERIAALAADGLTNPQIAASLHLSVKTVGHHLERVYAKLGLHSRRELILARSEPPRK